MLQKTILTIALFILCSFSNFYAQNLVSNPGFEKHGDMICLGCYGHEKFASLVENWRNLGFFADLYSTDYTFSNVELDRGYNHEKYFPFKGKAMVWLPAYLKSTEKYISKGGGGYLETTLRAELEKGKLYSMECWIHIRDISATMNAEQFPFLRHFGLSFSDKHFKLLQPNKELLETDSPFILDTVVIGEWVKLEHIIRPTRDLKYLIIGWFQHPYEPILLPHNHDITHFDYFVDDIVVKEIKSPDSIHVAQAIDYPFLNPPKRKVAKQKPVSQNAVVFFDFASDSLTSSAKRTLDTLVFKIKQDKTLVLELSGHTDIIGSKNKSLSLKRANTVKNYLMTKGGAEAWRFEISSFGEQKPIADNATETGRQLNRRVEISPAKHKVPEKLYKLASQAALQNKVDSAFYYLIAWQKFEEVNHILLLYDPDLTSLHNHKKWNGVKSFVRASFDKYKKSALAFRLANLYCKDQRYRGLGTDFEKAKGYIPEPLDISYEESMEMLPSEKPQIEKNTKELIEIFDTEGWPAPAEVGKELVEVPILLLLHSEDISLHKKYLDLTEKAFQDGKIKGKWYATVVDRIVQDEKGVQRYGTTYSASEENPYHYEIGPLEFPSKVDSLRATVGMPPLTLRSFDVVEEPDFSNE